MNVPVPASRVNRLARFVPGLTAALLLALAGCHKTSPAPAPPKPALTLLETGDIWGQVEPCG